MTETVISTKVVSYFHFSLLQTPIETFEIISCLPGEENDVLYLGEHKESISTTCYNMTKTVISTKTVYYFHFSLLQLQIQTFEIISCLPGE